METTTGTILVSVLMSCCLFLLWLYLGERRKVKKKKVIIKGLTEENVTIIETFYQSNRKMKEFEEQLELLKSKVDENIK